MATGRPRSAASWRTRAMVYACDSCVPCEKLTRATLSPASISAPIDSAVEVAGPSVQTTFVREIRIGVAKADRGRGGG